MMSSGNEYTRLLLAIVLFPGLFFVGWGLASVVVVGFGTTYTCTRTDPDAAQCVEQLSWYGLPVSAEEQTVTLETADEYGRGLFLFLQDASRDEHVLEVPFFEERTGGLLIGGFCVGLGLFLIWKMWQERASWQAQRDDSGA